MDNFIRRTLFFFFCSTGLLFSAEDILDKEFTLRKKIPYLYIEVETANRTRIRRDDTGLMTINFNPRKDQVLEIGGNKIQSPKNISGKHIEIGTFFLSKNHSDEEFLKRIQTWDTIILKALSSDEEQE